MAERIRARAPIGLRVGLAGRSAAPLAFLLLAALFYAPQLLGLRTFPAGDFTDHFLPFSLFQRSELLAGRLPVWNPYTYGGHPFLADVQAAVFYPLSNLVLGLTLAFGSPAARLYILEIEAALHLALAGYGTYLLVVDLTGRRAAGMLAGCVFAFSGYLTGYPPLQLAVLRTAAWLPLLLWLLRRAFTQAGRPDDRWRWTIWASLAYATAFLAGHSQTFLFVSYAAAAWIAVWFFAGPHAAGRRDWLLSAGQVALFYGLFLAACAAQLWPSIEFTQLSVRASMDYASLSGGFPLHDTWQMLLPGVLSLFSPLYVGLPALLLAWLAIAALALGRWRGALPGRRPLLGIAFFTILTLLALLVSYGANGFLYPIFYRWLPGWNLFRGQERAAYLVAVGLSVLAGYGSAALAEFRPAFVRGALAAGAALASVGIAVFHLALVGAGVVHVDPAALTGSTVLALASAWATAGCAFWLTAAHREARSAPQPWPRLALLGLALASLFVVNLPTNLGGGSPAEVTAPKPEVAALAAAVAVRGNDDQGLPARAYNEYRAYDDYGMAAHVEDVWGSSPLRLARYASLFTDFPLDRMWRLLGVEHVLTWRKALFGPSDLLAEFPQPKDVTYLHRLPAANPRAWVVATTQPMSDAEAVKALAGGQFNLDTTAVLPADVTPVAPVSPAAAQASSIQLSRPAPGQLIARVRAQSGGLLVVSENWMPGWQATLAASGAAGGAVGGAGQPATVYRADLTLLGVVVPAGDSTVTLSYRPASVRYGLIISGVTLAALLGLAILAAVRRPRMRP